MANEENLINLRDRTPEERKEIARKGAEATNEIKKKKKTMKEQAELLLSLAVKNPKLKKKMEELGLDEENQTNQMAMIISIMNKTIAKGDVQAFNTLQATIGEKPVEKVEISKSTDESIKKIDDYICKKKKENSQQKTT